MRECGGLHSRNCSDAPEHLIFEGRKTFLREFQPLERRGCGHDVSGTKTSFDREYVGETAREQERGCDEHERKRDLRDGQRASKSKSLAAGGNHAAATNHHRAWLSPSDAN